MNSVKQRLARLITERERFRPSQEEYRALTRAINRIRQGG